jgi:hypothetical protein
MENKSNQGHDPAKSLQTIATGLTIGTMLEAAACAADLCTGGTLTIAGLVLGMIVASHPAEEKSTR